MPVIVNDYEFSDAEMEQELPNHQDAKDAIKSAMTALVLRRVLLDEARHFELEGINDDAVIDALIKQEVKVPEAGREECMRHYLGHPHRFTVGELAEASHILFQVTSGVNLEILRKHAELILADLLENPQQFAECAKTNSNCPSSEEGGSLGQVGRGATVPEFENALFAAQANSIIPRLVETRFGFHIIQVGRKVEGKLLPFEEVEAKIAHAMSRASHDHAMRQYLQLLVGRAKISGIELEGADSPLLQ